MKTGRLRAGIDLQPGRLPSPPRSPVLAAVLLSLALVVAQAPAVAEDARDSAIGEFLLLLLGTDEGKRQALGYVEDHWQPGFTAMLLEVITFNRDPAFSAELVALLEEKTGEQLGYNIDAWFVWLWNQPPAIHPEYAEFKSAMYGLIDERFEKYFDAKRPAEIRLDEVLWGGVKQDGIPPLRNPAMLAVDAADYLDDGDVVFGLEVNGDARAYPRRILGWHEMFTDEVGGVGVAGVYCTLCGTMILYRTSNDGVNYELGTSGFLYRSNKLMYDRATQSLWNTIWGRPVIGPLAGRDISLERLSVVTTSWGEWRRRHPQTRVLDSNTGYNRDYSEGAAYRDYNASDALMFQVPSRDERLANKAEVLGLVLPQHPDQPLAISVERLGKQPIYHDAIASQSFVILTDKSGASRVYQSGGKQFVEWDGSDAAVDSTGNAWRLTEAALASDDGEVLHRLPAHRAFWFGWFSAYNHTRLVR